MKIQPRFTHDKVRFDKTNDVHLVVSLKAPKLDWEAKRPPVCIIPIIDVSGSMKGEKLDYAKKTLLKLVDHLRPGDYCGLGAFATRDLRDPGAHRDDAGVERRAEEPHR